MCRIAGIADPSQPVEQLRSQVEGMCRSQQHGGPDDEGIYSHDAASLVLGHRRLALLDLSPAGHQPMWSADGRYVVVYNGEIYNFPELKTVLADGGYPFYTGSDTEVILAAFASWGTASFQRFNGMFAFALFDTADEELYLVRDVSGIKPLYYSLQNGRLAFASEVRAFQHIPWTSAEHPHWPVYLMAYGHLPEPITTLKDVQPLKKGSFLQYSTRTGRAKTEIYSHYSYLENLADREEVLRRVSTTLRAAVQRHLLSDAPIGVFLSGGIDSSLMALLAGEVVGENLNTLSIFFKEKTFSEKAYQDLVRQHLTGNHHPFELNEADFHLHLPEIIDSMDLPSCDGINTWFISRAAKEAGLKAVLSGLGGDELFGGYPSFGRIRAAQLLQEAPAAMLRAGRYSRTKEFRRLSYLSLEGIRGIYLFLRGHFVPASIAAYLDLEEQEVWRLLEKEPVLSDIHHLSPENAASWMEFNLYMQNQLLRDADVMSMAHGVEIRVPFLDKEFVRLGLSLSSGVKYGGQYSKQLLIDAFRDVLPVGVWKRKKMGFTFPFADWLLEDEWVATKMMSGGKASIQMMNRFRDGQVHWSRLLTTLLLRTHSYAAQPAFLNA